MTDMHDGSPSRPRETSWGAPRDPGPDRGSLFTHEDQLFTHSRSGGGGSGYGGSGSRSGQDGWLGGGPPPAPTPRGASGGPGGGHGPRPSPYPHPRPGVPGGAGIGGPGGAGPRPPGPPPGDWSYSPRDADPRADGSWTTTEYGAPAGYTDPYDAGHPDGYGPDGPPPDRPGRHRVPPPGRPKWRKYTLRSLLALGVVVLLMVGYVGFEYWRLNRNIDRVDALEPNDKNIRDAEKQKDAENFLLIGSDTREGDNERYGFEAGQRSDTVMLAHLSPNHDRAILVSFPRDAWVTIPSCEQPDGSSTPEQEGMFNSAFSIGGPNCSIRTIQKLTGIAVNHYVQVDFVGFRSMVDALGGVEVCSTEAVFDENSGLRLNEGQNLLRGEQALSYVRARKGLGDGSDLDRIKRQQRFLGALIRKSTSGDVLKNPIKLRNFLNAATKSLTLDKDTGLGDLKNLADSLKGLDPAKVSFVTPPIANRDYDPTGQRVEGGGRVLLDADGSRALYDSIINDKQDPPTSGPSTAPSPAPSPEAPRITVAPPDVVVQVFNGAGQPGLATRARTDLESVGFTVAGTPSNRITGAAKSVVRYADGELESARTVATAVSGSVMEADPNLPAGTIELVVGSSYSGVKSVAVGSPASPAGPAGGTGSSPGTGTTPPPAAGVITPSDAINGADTSCV